MVKKPTYEELEKRIRKLEQSKSEAERVKDSLAEKSMYLYNILRSAGDVAIATTDLDFRITYYNPMAEKLFGYTAAEVVGKTVMEMHMKEKVVPDRFKQAIEIVNREGHYSYSLTTETVDGPCDIDSRVEGIFNQNGELVGFSLFSRDVTERKQAEEILQRSEALLKITQQLTKVGGWEWDVEKQTMFWTDEIYRIHDFQASEFLPGSTKHIEQSIECYDPEDRQVISEAFRNCVEKGQSYDLEFPFTTFKGKRIWIRTIAEPIRENGRIVKVIGNIMDITELKKSEEEKIQTQKITGEQKKLVLVGQIAGKMAHDFNNILGIIMGNTELFLLDCKDSETRETLELILEQTLRGKNLTKNLVAFARDQEPRQEFFRINEKINFVLNLFKNDLVEIELIKEEKPGVPDLLADSGMIEHALVNLIQNSIHATSMSEHPRITIRTYCLDDNICFEIEDNGCGIAQEYFAKIYEPSFTLKGSRDIEGSYQAGIKGTGYGMANVKKYIEQHKGNISVESEFGSAQNLRYACRSLRKN